MSPSAVPRAAGQGNQSVTEVAAIAMGPHARCSLQYAPSVAKIPRYLLNRAGTSRYIVAIATAKSESVDNAVLTLRAYIGRVSRPMYATRMCWCAMSLEVSLRAGETQESLLKRFQRMVQVSGVLREAKAHRHFLSKGETARLKMQKSMRRRRLGR